MIPGNTSSQGKQPTTPTIGTASAGNGQATVPFTESTYKGKTSSGTYRATSSPGGITGTCTLPCSSITVTGLSNGTAYTFTVRLETPYGVNSADSSASNSVTPVAPPFFPPFFPSFGPFFPPFFPSFCSCPSGGTYGGDGYCYYNCGTGSSSCACGPGSPTGYVAPDGTADCFYAASC